MDGAVLVCMASVALLVRVGIGLYTIGVSRSRNSASTSLRLVADICMATISFVLIGTWIAVGNAPWEIHPRGLTTTLVMTLIGSGIAVGVLGERTRFWPVVISSAVLGGVAIPLGMRVYSLFGGKLTDVAGATYLHVLAAAFACAGAVAVGPRAGKYHRDGSTSMIPGHSVPLAVLGTLIALAGWIPYVAPFVTDLGSAALGILLAATAGGLGGLFTGQLRYGKPDVGLTLVGLLGGLVSSTAGAGTVNPAGLLITGAVAGTAAVLMSIMIDARFKVDDPTGGVAVHGVGGAVGAVLTGLLAPGGAADRLQHVAVQIGGVLAALLVGGVVGTVLFVLMKKLMILRASEADEYDGVDLAEHDIAAYPDFQHNTIRSYHLRET